MKYRVFIIIGALMLPLIAVFAISRLAEPVGENTQPPKVEKPVPVAVPNNIGARGMSVAPSALPLTDITLIPDTLTQARTLAEKRRDELKDYTQAEWEIERLTILERNPPKTIEAAIARAEKRVTDLQAMTEEDWSLEKRRLKEREKRRQDSLIKKPPSPSTPEEAEQFRNDIESAFKRAKEGK